MIRDAGIFKYVKCNHLGKHKYGHGYGYGHDTDMGTILLCPCNVASSCFRSMGQKIVQSLDCCRPFNSKSSVIFILAFPLGVNHIIAMEGLVNWSIVT